MMVAPPPPMPYGMPQYPVPPQYQQGAFTAAMPNLPVVPANDEASRAAILNAGRHSYPLHAEEAHMGFSSDARYSDQVDQFHPLADKPGFKRVIVKLPHPRFEGAPEFIDSIPKHSSTFAWTEICGTNVPECSMAPVPQVAEKTWYNSRIYIPEQRSHVERQYLERFVPGPNGEWLDVVKARRMTAFLEEERNKFEEMEEEQRLVKSGDAVELTDYTDAYSGDHLVACNNQLLTKQQVYERYNIQRSDWGKKVDSVPAFDFDNLRSPWPFGRVDRNKRVSQNVYDWFDRRNPQIVSDRSYRLMELPSYYVDEDLYGKWRPTARKGVLGTAEDVYTRAQHFDDMPYQM